MDFLNAAIIHAREQVSDCGGGILDDEQNSFTGMVAGAVLDIRNRGGNVRLSVSSEWSYRILAIDEHGERRCNGADGGGVFGGS
jgi:hypothetical protein